MGTEIKMTQRAFYSDSGTTDAIFIVDQQQAKHLAANNLLGMLYL